jgi:hypothetical protein
MADPAPVPAPDPAPSPSNEEIAKSILADAEAFEASVQARIKTMQDQMVANFFKTREMNQGMLALLVGQGPKSPATPAALG